MWRTFISHRLFGFTIFCQVIGLCCCASRQEAAFEHFVRSTLKRDPSDETVLPDFLKYLLRKGAELKDDQEEDMFAGCEFRVYEHDECHQRLPQSFFEGKVKSPPTTMAKRGDKLEEIKRRLLMEYLRPAALVPGVRYKRNALRCSKWLWPEGVVPYAMRIQDEAIRSQFYSAVKQLESLSCVRFVETSQDVNVGGKTLQVVESRPVPGERCRANVGRVGAKPTLQISTVCTEGQVLHELMHVLGFAHEHTRPDRDNYIKIECANMLSNMTADFRRLRPSVVTSFGEEYDFYSIMHYKLDHFTSNGKDTITPRVEVDRSRVGEMKRLSHKDITKLNKLYKCNR